MLGSLSSSSSTTARRPSTSSAVDVCGGGYHPFPAQATASDEPFRLLAVAYCAAHSNDEAQLHITTKPLGNYSYGKSSSLRSRRHLPVALSAK